MRIRERTENLLWAHTRSRHLSTSTLERNFWPVGLYQYVSSRPCAEESVKGEMMEIHKIAKMPNAFVGSKTNDDPNKR